MRFSFDDRQVVQPELSARIKVVGVGGGGGNAVNNMVNSGLRGIDFIAANTDAQSLAASLAPTRLQIGANLTKGLGAGSNPAIGREAAEEDGEKVREALEGADMVFVTAGMGGGTGTGAAPVIARLAREMGALTVAVVTRPFMFEARARMQKADAGIEELRQHVDTIIIVQNQKLLAIVEQRVPLQESFRLADDVLRQAVQGISDIVLVPGYMNVDFADVKAVMCGMGRAIMGTGVGTGDSRAKDAAHKAIACPLLEDATIEGARGVLINVTGGEDLTLHEVNEAAAVVQELADPDANIILGSVIDPDREGEVMVTVIATGFGGVEENALVEAGVSSGKTVNLRQFLSRQADRDKPTFLRKAVGADFQPEPANLEGEDYEIPAFLRKGAN
ncbi:MAG: cell division protein FtsZ [Nitrospirae bacterium RBG_16_64_22]|nr:MAG: cell division protein FtsZ [Nitrospirae bacterium RBG_16_64_22]